MKKAGAAGDDGDEPRRRLATPPECTGGDCSVAQVGDAEGPSAVPTLLPTAAPVGETADPTADIVYTDPMAEAAFDAYCINYDQKDDSPGPIADGNWPQPGGGQRWYRFMTTFGGSIGIDDDSFDALLLGHSRSSRSRRNHQSLARPSWLLRQSIDRLAAIMITEAAAGDATRHGQPERQPHRDQRREGVDPLRLRAHERAELVGSHPRTRTAWLEPDHVHRR